MHLDYAMNELSKAFANTVLVAVNSAVATANADAMHHIIVLTNQVATLTARLSTVETAAHDRIAALEEEVFQLKAIMKAQEEGYEEEEEYEVEEEYEEEVEEEYEEEVEVKEEKPQKMYPTYNYRDVLRYYPRPTSGFHYTAVVLRSGEIADCIHSSTSSLEVRFDTIEDWIASLKDKGNGQEELYVNMYSSMNERERDAQRANWRDRRCKANTFEEERA
jgi:hypothetical protein